MKKDLRIIFMGTPDFAVATLAELIKSNYNIVGVITAPDKPAGRGRKLNESSVKQYAKIKGLHILQPTNLKDDAFIKDLKVLKANLQIVVAFRMLPKIVWQMPKYGTFNLHASLLPNYRGAAPIHWAIINGETKTGVTTFFIDEKIDTGALILQKEIDIKINETVGDLHDKLMIIGSDLVVETIELIKNGNVTTTIQPKDIDIKTAHKLNKDNCKIDWNDTLGNIYNKVRGLNPFPVAWSILKNGDKEINIKIYAVDTIQEKHHLEIGQLIINNHHISVAVKNGFIKLNEIQLPGKRKMDTKSLINGFIFHEDAKML